MEEYDIEFFEYLVQAQMEALKDREFEIFGLRYGLTVENPCSLKAIGEIFKVSRERIRQILNVTTQAGESAIEDDQRKVK